MLECSDGLNREKRGKADGKPRCMNKKSRGLFKLQIAQHAEVWAPDLWISVSAEGRWMGQGRGLSNTWLGIQAQIH